MEEATADKLREYVHQGGTLVMTAYSAQLNEHGQVFAGTLPGRLSDVFGIRVSGFEETSSLNELSRVGLCGNAIRLELGEHVIDCESPRFDLVWPNEATVLGHIVSFDRDYPAVTSNRYGSGTAIYIGLPAREAVLGIVVNRLLEQLSIPTGPEVPTGVMARCIDGNHALYLNLDGTPKHIRIDGRSRSLLHQQDYTDGFILAAHEPDFVEFENLSR